MRKLTSFNFLTLNGFLSGPDGDISWHRHGMEENQFAADSLGAQSTLIFGRVTYEMMAGYWPTEMALENDPTVAKGMNSAEKIVFSNTLKNANWENTRVISGDIATEMRNIKKTEGKDLTILGSGSIVTFFAEHGLIDAYHLMVDPVAIGDGNTIFRGLKSRLMLKLTGVEQFKSGVILLSYKPE